MASLPTPTLERGRRGLSGGRPLRFLKHGNRCGVDGATRDQLVAPSFAVPPSVRVKGGMAPLLRLRHRLLQWLTKYGFRGRFAMSCCPAPAPGTYP